ncbi:hypothetical protein HK405_005977, partial [Cladochytrium tenue]
DSPPALVPVTSAVVPVVAPGVAAEVVLDEDAAELVPAEPEATSDATADDVAELVVGDVKLATMEAVDVDIVSVVTGVSDAGSSMDVMSRVGLDVVTVSLVDVVGTATVTVSEDDDGVTTMTEVLVEVGISGMEVVVVTSGVIVLVRPSWEMDVDGESAFVIFVVSVVSFAAASEGVAKAELPESVRIADVATGSSEDIITDPFKDMAQRAIA